jgi:hypothetical protein
MWYVPKVSVFIDGTREDAEAILPRIQAACGEIVPASYEGGVEEVLRAPGCIEFKGTLESYRDSLGEYSVLIWASSPVDETTRAGGARAYAIKSAMRELFPDLAIEVIPLDFEAGFAARTGQPPEVTSDMSMQAAIERAKGHLLAELPQG